MNHEGNPIEGNRYYFHEGGREDWNTERLKNILAPYFLMKEQWEGTHFSGKRVRADLLIKPKDTSEWKNKDVVFAVEIKSGNQDGRLWSECTRHMAQSIDYANTRWDRYGFLPVLAFPAFVPFCERMDRGADFAVRLAGQLGIGFILINDTIEISMCGNCVWRSDRGVQKGKYWKFERKFGSR